MTTFDPEIAYRILYAKQCRLYQDAHTHLRNRIEAELDGHRNDVIWNWHQAMYEFCSSEADKMWDVLEYLRDRIYEEEE